MKTRAAEGMGLLTGVRVVTLEQYAAGPFATQLLADWGAEVVKVENPDGGGDVSRYVPPFQEGADSLFFQTFNRGKKSICLDLKDSADRKTFDALVDKADVLFANVRGDVPERLGLRYERYEMSNPKLVCSVLSGFGLDGPRRSEPAMDYLVQAAAGYMSLTGEPSGPPTRCGVSVIDFATGYAAASAIVAGLLHVARTGRGLNVDINLFDTALSMLSYVATWELNRNFTVGRQSASAHPTIVPCQMFETADGFIFIMCQKEHFWRSLCDVLDRAELITDPRFESLQTRLRHRDELTSILQDEFLKKTSEEWMDRLRGRVPCSPVNTVSDALRDPQVTERDRLFSVNHPVFGDVVHLRSPISFSEGEALQRSVGPGLGEHTEEVLRSWLGSEDIDGVSGSDPVGA